MCVTIDICTTQGLEGWQIDASQLVDCKGEQSDIIMGILQRGEINLVSIRKWLVVRLLTHPSRTSLSDSGRRTRRQGRVGKLHHLFDKRLLTRGSYAPENTSCHENYNEKYLCGLLSELI